MGLQTNKGDEIIRGIRQGGERTTLANVEERLRRLSVAASKAADAANDEAEEDWLLGEAEGLMKAADLVKIAIENG